VNFVDTTIWVGEADENDDFHESSHAVVEGIRTGRTALAITTDFVLDETVTILGRRRGFGATNATRVAANIMASPRVFVVYTDETLLKESLLSYPAYSGKLSLTDVVSTTVMKKYGVRQIFSHDHDFDKVEGVRRAETLSLR
jgi:predicted nucleic acid-binding protein